MVFKNLCVLVLWAKLASALGGLRHYFYLLSMLTFLVRGLLEEIGQTVQGHVIAVEVVGHALVDVRRVELDVYLFVDGHFALLVVVLSAKGHHVDCCMWSSYRGE